MIKLIDQVLIDQTKNYSNQLDSIEDIGSTEKEFKNKINQNQSLIPKQISRRSITQNLEKTSKRLGQNQTNLSHICNRTIRILIQQKSFVNAPNSRH